MGRSGTVRPLIPPGNSPGGDRLEAAPVGGVHSLRSPCAGHPVTCLAGSGPWSPHSGVQGLFAQRPAGLRPPGCPGLSCCEVSAQGAWSRSSPPGSLPCPRGKEAEEESLWGVTRLFPRLACAQNVPGRLLGGSPRARCPQNTGVS